MRIPPTNKLQMNKNITLLFSLYLFFAGEMSFSQANKFELKGYIKDLKNGKIALRETLLNQNIEGPIDEMLIQNGKFKFNGRISDPTEVRLIINDTLFTDPFFIEFGKQQTTLEIDSLSYPLMIKGSRSNYEYINTYNPKMRQFENRRENWYTDKWALERAFDGKIPALINDSMETILKTINRQKDSTLLSYIYQYPTSRVAVWNLFYRVYGQGYLSVYDSAYILIDRKLKQSKTGIALRKLLSGGRQTAVGVIFPNINTIDSLWTVQNVFTKSTNKFILIDFWFSNCLPCIRQFGELKSIYNTYRSKGFEITGVSIDKKENEIQWRNTVSKYSLPWPQLWDIDAKEATLLSINTFPSNFLLDCNGKIIAKNIEPFQLEKFLKENLGIL